MSNIKKYDLAQPTRARLVTGFKTTALLAPFALSGAFAQTGGASQLAEEAKGQMEGLVGLLVGLLVIGIGISVLWFANKNVKKGVNKAG